MTAEDAKELAWLKIELAFDVACSRAELALLVALSMTDCTADCADVCTDEACCWIVDVAEAPALLASPTIEVTALLAPPTSDVCEVRPSRYDVI